MSGRTDTSLRDSRPILALDTTSPLVSVAVGIGSELLAERSVAIRQSSARLLPLVDEVLSVAGLDLHGLGGVVALQGPGSFTGMRIGLATVLGLHQALALPATALPTLEVLAAADYRATEAAGATPQRCLAVVDALRGEWFCQPFEPGPRPTPLAPPSRLTAEDIRSHGPRRVVGFGATGIGQALDDGAELHCHEPGPLAGIATALASRPDLAWDPGLLTQPLYLRPPAVTPAAPAAP